MLRNLRQTWIDAPTKNRVLAALALVLFIGGAIASQFGRDVFLKSHGIYFEKHTMGCLPWMFYMADKQVQQVNRGDVMLFASRGAVPLFKDGSPLVKMVIGMPGDKIVSKDGKLFVNGRYWGSLVHGLLHFHKPAGFWDRDIVLQKDEYFMLGSEPRSFDSRFWGVVRREQFRAKLHLIL